MTNLRRYTVSKDTRQKDWTLKDDATQRVVRRFETKADATAGGVLPRALGTQGGTVRIQREHGGFQEERTFPRSEDPRRSPG